MSTFQIFHGGDTVSVKRAMPLYLWGYILKDFFLSFFIILFFFVIVFIANQILLLAKDVLQIDIPFVEVVKLLGFALPNILSLSIPFATLVACLMSVGHFSTFNEIVAMRFAGMSFISIFIPYLVFSLLIMGMTFFVNEVMLPWGAINFSKQYRKTLELNPQLGLEQNSIKRYQDKILITKQVLNDKIEGLIIIDNDSAGDKRVILSEKAFLKSNADQNGIISIELSGVNVVSTTDIPSEYSYMIGEYMIYNILLNDFTLDVRNLTPDQKSIKDLYFFVQEEYTNEVLPLEVEKDENMAVYLETMSQEYKKMSLSHIYDDPNEFLLDTQVKKSNLIYPYYARYSHKQKDLVFSRNERVSEIVFYRKLAFPFAVVLFVFIAFPMGIFYKRSGRSVGFGVGLLLSFVYWFLIVMNQSVGISYIQSPAFLIMWYPNIIIGVLGLVLLVNKRN